ncbi:hypothetical protein [Yimella lutea]|nr:hypothetical protein [Yimella lutea]
MKRSSTRTAPVPAFAVAITALLDGTLPSAVLCGPCDEKALRERANA